MADYPRHQARRHLADEVSAKLASSPTAPIVSSRIGTGKPFKPEPVPYVSFRLRMSLKGAVHQSELDTGSGIITVCGGYALSGKYERSSEPVTCRRCLRSLAPSSSPD